MARPDLAIGGAYKAIQNGFTARFVTAAALIDELSAASRTAKFREALHAYLQPSVLVIDEVGYLTYGDDAANVLFHVVNERCLKGKPMIFNTNKTPLGEWGDVLRDHDLADAIVDRILERGRLSVLDGPSYRTRHIRVDQSASRRQPQPDRVSGISRIEFPKPTGVVLRGLSAWRLCKVGAADDASGLRTVGSLVSESSRPSRHRSR